MKYVLAFLGIVIFAFGLSVLFAYPVKWLWNDVGVDVLNLRPIDLWQAWKLSFLSGLLFKSSNISLKDD